MKQEELRIIEKEHGRIVEFLQKDFIPYCKEHRYGFKIDLDLFFEVARKNFGASQDKIAEEYRKVLCEKIPRKEISQSKISRDISLLNETLKVFCKEKKISSAIQIYIFLLSSNKNRNYVGFFFACAKKPEGNTAQDIVSLDEARKNSKSPLQEPVKLKYLRDMRDVLKWDNHKTKAQWFRKSGPIAADFRAGYVYERKELLEELHKLVSNNKISILEGDGGTGKSVVIRNYAYNAIKNKSDLPIYYYCFKLDLPIDDYRILIQELNSVNGMVILEDIHLAAPAIQCVIEEFAGNCTILLITRSMFEFNMLKSHSCIVQQLERLSIGGQTELDWLLGLDPFNDIDQIIEHYIRKRFGENYPWTSWLRESVRPDRGSLWLLSYALAGCTEDGYQESCIAKGVIDDLEDIEKRGGNPEILLALSPLYMREIPTSQLFLLKTLGFDRTEINKLVEMGEIIKQDFRGKTFYGLPHSSLALAYWKYGHDYRNCLLFPEYNDFVYNYVTSDAPNGLEAATRISPEAVTYVLNKLVDDNKILSVIEKEENKEAYSFLSNVFADTFDPDKDWPYKLSGYYSSESFLKYLLQLLLDHHFFDEAVALAYRYSFRLNSYILQTNVNTLLDEIYCSKKYDSGCGYLFEICRHNKTIESQVIEILDPVRFAEAANKDKSLEKIWMVLRYLIFIEKNLGLTFWKNLDKPSILNTFTRDDFVTKGGLLWRIAAGDPKIKSDICKMLDCKKLAQAVNECENPASTWSILESLSQVDGRLELALWDRLDKNRLVEKSLSEEDAGTIIKTLFYVYEVSPQIQNEFFDNYFNRKTIEAIIYEPGNFSSIIKRCSLSMSDEANQCKLWDSLDPAKIEHLYKQHEDIFERINFSIYLCKIKSKLSNTLIHLLRKDVAEFADISVRRGQLKDISQYDSIAKADTESGQIILKHICEQAGIEKYIKGVFELNSPGYNEDCFEFLRKVDPENKLGWGKYFDWEPLQYADYHRPPRKSKKKSND